VSVLFLFAAALAGATPTAAGATETVKKDVRDIREVKARYGECVVSKHLLAARSFVLKPDAKWRNDERIGDGDCLLAAIEAADEAEMKFPGDAMRYALAEALVRREFSTGPSASITDAAPLAQPKLDEADYAPKPGKKYNEAELKELADSRSKQEAIIFLASFGECIVRADPAQSYALIMSQHSSKEESAAFAGLNATLGQCFPTGQSLAFTRVILRGTVAMNYYRLAHAPRVAAPVGASQ